MRNTRTYAIVVNLAMLLLRLNRAHATGMRAADLFCKGHRNLAIATLLDLQRLLPEADALTRTIMALHRSDRDAD